MKEKTQIFQSSLVDNDSSNEIGEWHILVWWICILGASRRVQQKTSVASPLPNILAIDSPGMLPKEYQSKKANKLFPRQWIIELGICCWERNN